MKSRRGFTLVELIVAMSIFAVILPLSGWMVYVLLRAQTASADSLVDAMALSRFARSFRSDVHVALSAKIETNPLGAHDRVVLKLDSLRTVMYAVHNAGSIERIAKSGERVERREEFWLAGTQTRFEMEADAATLSAVHSPRAVTSHGGPATTATIPIIRIECVIARDRLLERPWTASRVEPPPPALPRRPREKGSRP
jgi:prepilin-type N-terminal cleavage/methylation domain-containing protein